MLQMALALPGCVVSVYLFINNYNCMKINLFISNKINTENTLEYWNSV